jgi:predicted DNA-binding antitoxin AbrB/MazE fold protein
MTATMKATYEKGVLRLSEPIRVPEGATVYITLIEDDQGRPPRYPAAIEEQYQALTAKELSGTLTPEEACRLQDICNLIAEIDRLTPGADIRVRQAEKLLEEMGQIRAELEALPDRADR